MSNETFLYESHTDTPIPEEVKEAAKRQPPPPAKESVAGVAKTILGDQMP